MSAIPIRRFKNHAMLPIAVLLQNSFAERIGFDIAQERGSTGRCKSCELSHGEKFKVKQNNSLINQNLRLVECHSNDEWRVAKHYRQHYFIDKAGLKDPYTQTFDHKEHKHFVLYLDDTIIGYAHVQLWPQNKAALRIIAIDGLQRNHGYGSCFLSLIEDDLKKSGYKDLHAEANPEAVAFYKKNSYTEMPFNDPDNYPSDPADTALGKWL